MQLCKKGKTFDAFCFFAFSKFRLNFEYLKKKDDPYS